MFEYSYLSVRVVPERLHLLGELLDLLTARRVQNLKLAQLTAVRRPTYWPTKEAWD